MPEGTGARSQMCSRLLFWAPRTTVWNASSPGVVPMGPLRTLGWSPALGTTARRPVRCEKHRRAHEQVLLAPNQHLPGTDVTAVFNGEMTAEDFAANICGKLADQFTPPM